MRRTLTMFGLAAGMCVSLPVAAQTTTYTFGTVTAVDLDHEIPSIVGLQKDTGAPLTLAFVDRTNVSFRYVVNRCVPLFLTMMEKPGRYDLQSRRRTRRISMSSERLPAAAQVLIISAARRARAACCSDRARSRS